MFEILNTLNKGDKVTLLYISKSGLSRKCEYIIKKRCKAQKDGTPYFEVTQVDTRTALIYYPKPDQILLPGHDLPIYNDDTLGNFLFNLVADSPEQAKEILTQSLIPLSAFHREHIAFSKPSETETQIDYVEGVLLFGEEIL